MKGRRQPYRLIDLFAGAGCFTLGFTQEFGHNFVPVWANEIDPSAAESYNANFGHCCVPGDIVDILNDPITVIPEADVVIGGPPCQGFSLLNKNRDGDPRKELWRPFFEVVKRSNADIFVMENVPQLIGSSEHGEILGTADALGFKVESQKLLAADYGVPQIRYRAFILGCKFCDPKDFFPPRKTHYNPNNGKSLPLDLDGRPLKEWVTVWDAIHELPPPVGTEIRQIGPPLDLHFSRTPTKISIARYKAIPKE